MAIKVLIVGAGSVGQVYGYHLSQGGAETTYLVKEVHAEAAKRGFVLYQLGKKREYPEPRRFDQFTLKTKVSDLVRDRYDYVLICTPSTAFADGDWFSQLAESQTRATFVVFAVGLDEYGLAKQFVDRERLIVSLITMMSYSAPSPGEELQLAGTAYWFLPTSKFEFTGEHKLVRALTEALTRGGMPSRYKKDILKKAALTAPMLQMSVLALGCANWDLDQLSKNKSLRKIMLGAIRESAAIGLKKLGHTVPLPIKLLPSWLVILVLKLTKRIAPTDLEAFFKKHYTKVKIQSLEILEHYILIGQKQSLQTLNLVALSAVLNKKRSHFRAPFEMQY